MPAKKTNEDYVNDMKYYYGDDFIPVTEYTRNYDPMTFRHKCGHEYTLTQSVRAFNRGLSCPKCGKEKIETVEEINKKLLNRYNQEYTLLTEFKEDDKITFKTKITLLHSECENEIETTVEDFFLKCKVCKDCKRDRNKFTVKDFEKYLEENTKGEYIISENNILKPNCVDDKITLTHTKCGRDYNVAMSKFKVGRRCPLCNNDDRRLSEYDVLKKLNGLVDSGHYEFSIIETYQNVQSMIHVLHKDCGNEYDMRLADILYHNQRCPICSASISENKVAFVLDSLNLNYTRQHKFPDCKNINQLPFDFRVVLDENTIFLIEFNGLQHYIPIEYFDGDEGFEKRIKRDKIKTDYCKENNIPLLIIHYSQINSLESVIKAFITNLRS